MFVVGRPRRPKSPPAGRALLRKKQPAVPTLTWKLDVLGSHPVELQEDRQEEEYFSSIRASWEARDAGRAVRPSRFLDIIISKWI